MNADPIAALVELMKADAGVAAVASTRVFGGELPAAEAASMPRGALVIVPAGGTSLTAGSDARHDTQRLDVMCYGATPYEAQRLRDAAHAALKPIRRAVASATLIHWVQPAGGFTTGRDRDAGWPVAAQSYQVFYAEQAAA